MLADDNYMVFSAAGTSVQHIEGAADALGRIAVAAHTGYCAGSFAVEALGIHRRCDIARAMDSAGKVMGDFIAARDDNDFLWPEAKRGDAVAAAVDIDNNAVLADSIGAEHKDISGELLAAYFKRLIIALGCGVIKKRVATSD